MASRLSDLVRDGALNEVLACLNRAADGAGEATIAGRADLLFRALDRLSSLTDALSQEVRRTLLNSAEFSKLGRFRQSAKPEDVTAEQLARWHTLVHVILERPDQKLAAYGTLVPGGRNHRRVAHLGGTWQRCFVRGGRWTAADGDPRFRWSPDDPEVDAMLLVSEDLPSAWPELDRFERSEYRRHLVPVRGEDAHHVAYLYESADQAISK